MERSTTATFIGHSECYGLDEGRVLATIEQLIHAGITTFLCGGMGAFDWLCARQVYQAKQQYSEMECLLVIPYLSFRIRERKYFDDILYPEGFEKYHFKAAIPERNRFMVNHSSYADNINFFANVNGYEINISLDCYTHAVYRHGIQLYP